ncbi:terminase [Streptomyces sp. NBC_00654]|uniref:terminase n=1 Tax=Streptomyces sp. NBC_00654 TaxID=2975799 RepID=UPI0022531E12|nr:terminase [Streptomyces sp. NBC_00654]MCX4971171.1 terminase [Streptomyces sp. NBC_00654]
MPWRGPQYEGERPTLGYYVLDWMMQNLAQPGRDDGEPFIPTAEQAEFLLRYYEVHPLTGKRVIHRALLSRPRGWGKSPFVGAIALTEACADVVADGFDADGEPVGRPWHSIRTPLVRIAAVTEQQTDNTWIPLLEMARGRSLSTDYGLEVLDTVIYLPRGEVSPITSSATSTKGDPACFASLDQTEEWTATNGGVRLAKVMRFNAAKLGGSLIETPNAYTPGVGSVAEKSAADYQAIIDGRSRARGILADHREAPPETDMTDEQSLVAGLRYAYGDSSDHPDGCVLHDPPCSPGWSPIERLTSEFWDTSNEPQDLRADLLNQITHAADAWLTEPEVRASSDLGRSVQPGDRIVLGFDGSRKRARGVTDATALIGCRLSDGHLFTIGVWEQPERPQLGPDGAPIDWQVPVVEVLAAVHEAFATYDVVGFYADPAKWESHVADWEAAYGPRLQVQATRNHPVEWWMTGGRSTLIVRALEKFHTALTEGELTHDGASALVRHLCNARRRPSRSGLQIAKAHPDSPNKIDAAVASVLAWQCRLDAIAKGVAVEEEEMFGGTF